MGPVRVGSLVRLLVPGERVGWSDANFFSVKGIDLEFVSTGPGESFRTVPYGTFGIVTGVERVDALHPYSVTCYWSGVGRQTERIWVLGCEYEVVVF